ncbi:3-deoxy-7-phosphoheptulonate synthase [Silvanigrella aquatica]|uniref:Phospho-2-dehydro-3-deoxyheptonate aldolase n=1 Tax=Silvanigrella aquatica TaxID=1915309 RepID=A0A1L4D0A4_9BACT|nr:3-deoxy-7-phosphoheptulonate synthase [Silvanigrella aquatica]APJ03620.1 hypothetical protein AXG55_06750 [Silvanigrella aquatica]
MKPAKLNDTQYLPWHPESWINYRLIQQPEYPNQSHLFESLHILNSAETLVTEEEILLNRHYISEAAKGNIFVLQAGDCAETFDSCQYGDVIQRVTHLQDLSEIIQNILKKPVVTIGRIAGQYAKPRSEEFEIQNGFELPSYRGDIINNIEFKKNKRVPEPKRLLEAFENSKLTLNWIRKYFHENNIAFKNSRFFTSHEALLLNYESCLTRKSKISDNWFNYGAHYLWLGERTRDLNSAHIEYLRGISNPIGIKIGPKSNAQELIDIIKILNPNHIPGKINLITRIGANKVCDVLTKIIVSVNKAKTPVTWSCDPMHGNSFKTQNGIKTRDFESIFKELMDTYSLHNELGSILAGIHLELTHLNVTECLGGQKSNVTENNLLLNYQTYCDPRLNKEQSLELIHKFAKKIN